jgi:hypothetical protein
MRASSVALATLRASLLADVEKGHAAGLAGRANERNAHFIGHVEQLDEHMLALFQLGGMADENARELIESGIVHGQS